MRREPAIGPLRLPARRRDGLIDRIPPNRASQHPQRDLVRQPTAGNHLSTLRHRAVIIAASRQTATNDTPTHKINLG
jgi:hypothetical protein